MDSGARKALRRNPFAANRDGAGFDRIALPNLADRLNGRGQMLLQEEWAQKSVGSFFANSGFFLRPQAGGAEGVTDAFLESWVVYVCATLLADKVASIPIQVWNGIGDDAAEVSEKDPVVQRLYRPNRDTTWSQFAARGIIHRRLSGEDIWFLMDLAGQPKVQAGATAFDLPDQIVNVTGSAVEDERDPSTGRILRWKYAGSGGSVVPWFPSSSIVHFADYDPNDPQRGIGAAEAAARQIAIGFQAERYQEAVMRSGGLGGFLVSKERMGPEHEEALQARMDDAAKDPNAANRLKLLTGEWDVKPGIIAPKDMAGLEFLKWSRNVIASLMRVPLLCIGVTEDSTYANLDTAWREFWSGVRDYLNGVAEVMNSAFFPKLKGPGAKYRCSFDFSKVKYLRDISGEDFDRALKAAAAGIGISFNAASEALKIEIDPVEGGDRQLVNGMLVEAEAFDAESEEPEEDPPTDPDKAAKTVRAYRHPALTDAKVRAQYHADWLIRAGVMRHERRLALTIKRYLAAYERAQIARLKLFAEKGPEGVEPNRPLPAKSVSGAVQKISGADIERWLLLYKREWEERLGVATARTIASAFETAAADAARELGALSIDGSDPRVLAFLKDQEIKLVEGVTSTLAQRVKVQVLDVLQGSTNTAELQSAVREMLPELTDKLRGSFSTKDQRALVIARTETAHASNGARFMQFEDAGVTKTQWITAGDEHVRDSHKAVDGDVQPLGVEFRNGLRWPSDPEGPAGEVINCLLPGSLVQGRIVAGLKSVYAGPAWEIKTLGGQRLRVTPNHPVLTDEGWRPAHALTKGDRLICAAGNVDRLAVKLDVDHQHGPARVEDVFDALAANGRVVSTVVGGLDLHGDARFGDGEIHVVGVDRKLRKRRDSPLSHGRRDLGLELSDASASPLKSNSAGNDSLVGVLLAPALGVRGGRLKRAPNRIHLTPLQPLCIGSAANLHARASEAAKEKWSAEPRLVRELLQAGSGLVAIDEVSEVRELHFRGHVYDLQSETGWIIADGIASGNCRCTAVAVDPEE